MLFEFPLPTFLPFPNRTFLLCNLVDGWKAQCLKNAEKISFTDNANVNFYGIEDFVGSKISRKKAHFVLKSQVFLGNFQTLWRSRQNIEFWKIWLRYFRPTFVGSTKAFVGLESYYCFGYRNVSLLLL